MAEDKDIVGKGFRIVFRSGTVMKKVQDILVEELNKAGQKYYEAVLANVNLTDHDLKDLKTLGYPYSHSGTPVHGDDRLVHTQSGELREGIKLHSASITGARSAAVYLTSEAPYTDFLLYGTSRMRPRRFDEKAWEDVGKLEIFDDLKDRLRGFVYKIGLGK